MNKANPDPQYTYAPQVDGLLCMNCFYGKDSHKTSNKACLPPRLWKADPRNGCIAWVAYAAQVERRPGMRKRIAEARKRLQIPSAS